MSVRKLTASLLTALAMLGAVTTSQAQEYVPVADPFQFDPDFQWFEPVYEADLLDMKPKKRAPSGWFAMYERQNLHGSRPELDTPGSSDFSLDNGWGNRYEIGYMLPGDDNGWTFVWTEANIGEFQQVRRERLNRINIDDLTGDPDNPGPPFGFGEPARERNNLGYNTRFYDVTTVLNEFKLDVYELNKTFRLEPYHYGGILEPMVGIRWMRLFDVNAFQQYNSALDTDRVPYLDFPNAEQLITNTAITRNEMFGFQLGARYFKYRERFRFTGQFQVFFGGNWQETLATQYQEITSYDNIGTDADVTFIIDRETDPIYERNDEFFVGFDVRGAVEYQLTKQISATFGAQLIDIATGVWRGGAGNFVAAGDQDQDVLMVGAFAGINVNH